jgi:PPE family protein
MDLVKEILGQNWPFYSHQKLYDMVRTEAPGVGAMASADLAWMEFVTLMAESRQNVERLLREAGAAWEGLAGESMQTGVSPLVQWVEDATAAGEASSDSVRQVRESFAYTSNAMPEPVEPAVDPRFPPTFRYLFAGQIDQDARDHLAQEAKRHAVELMELYSSNAGAAVDSVGAFVPPQDVTVAAAPHQSFGGPVGHAVRDIVTAPPDPGRGAVEHATHPPAPDAGSPSTPSGQPSGHGSRPAVPPAATHTSTADAVGSAGPATTTPAGEGTRPAGSSPWFGGGTWGPGPAAREPARSRGRAGTTGVTPPTSDHPASGWGAAAAPRPAASGMGPLLPVGGVGRTEDEEHRSPDFLRDYHDELWGADGLPVVPPVIGADDPTPRES